MLHMQEWYAHYTHTFVNTMKVHVLLPLQHHVCIFHDEDYYEYCYNDYKSRSADAFWKDTALRKAKP